MQYEYYIHYTRDSAFYIPFTNSQNDFVMLTFWDDSEDDDDCARVDDEFDDVRMLFECKPLDKLELLQDELGLDVDEGRKILRPFTFSNNERYTPLCEASDDSAFDGKLVFLSI